MNGFRTAWDFRVLAAIFGTMCVCNSLNWWSNPIGPVDTWGHRALIDAAITWALWRLAR